MAMTIGHNLGAMNALSALNSNSNALQSALQQLSTGKKINSAADNASGYAISQKMQAQISGLNQASQNAQDGISMIQTASGALNQTISLLQNMRQLAVQASNSTTTQADREDLQSQFNQLADQINNIGNTTQFNTQNLLQGGMGATGLIASPGTLAGGNSTTPATASIDFSSITDANGVESLVGKGFTVNGQAIQFYDSSKGEANGSGIAVDLNGVTDGAGVVSAIAAQVGDQISGVTLTQDATTTQLDITATQNGTGGNNITYSDGYQFQSVFQIGANTGQTMTLTIGDMRAKALGITGQAGTGNFGSANDVTDGTNNTNVEAALDITDTSKADQNINVIDNAIQTVTTQQAQLGAVQNRLQSSISNLDNTSQNLTTAESGITDTDMASTMAEFTQDNVLQQAAVSMLDRKSVV